jgi:hypothetical protein
VGAKGLLLSAAAGARTGAAVAAIFGMHLWLPVLLLLIGMAVILGRDDFAVAIPLLAVALYGARYLAKANAARLGQARQPRFD